jgi:hypothetical protein
MTNIGSVRVEVLMKSSLVLKSPIILLIPSISSAHAGISILLE